MQPPAAGEASFMKIRGALPLEGVPRRQTAEVQPPDAPCKTVEPGASNYFGESTMKKFLPLFVSLCGFAVAATGANAQFYKLHGADIGGGAIGQITTPLPANNFTRVNQTSTDSFGGLFSLRDHPVPWAGLEFNYAFTEYHQYYTDYNSSSAVIGTLSAKNHVHEATAAYMFHPKAHFLHPLGVEPFLNLGGGYLDFVPVDQLTNQWRGTGLVELGFDIPTSNPHMGFRVQGRELIYRQPDFNQPNLASRTWVATSEPMFGVWYRW